MERDNARNTKEDVVLLLKEAIEENKVFASFNLAKNIYDVFMEKVLTLLKNNGELRIHELGIFNYKVVKSRICTLPKSLGVQTKEGSRLKFRPSNAIKFIEKKDMPKPLKKDKVNKIVKTDKKPKKKK